MDNRKLRIRDLTLRDGQQSLFATRMPQAMINELLPLYQNAGFYIMEVWGGAIPDSVMRYLGESPWDRLRIASQYMKGRSLLSALSRGRNLFGYVPYPNSVLEGFYKEAIANGLNVMRIFDALNDIDNIRDSIRMVNDLGGIADGAVCYTVDPKDEEPAAPAGFMGRLKSAFGLGSRKDTPEKIFTDDYFVGLAQEMERTGAKIITLKDMAGLVNPLRAASVISRLKQAVKVPVDFHTHCTPGYGLASALMAILNGVDILDTNIWWFGGGSAAPAIELIYVFCTRLGIEVEADMKVVGQIRDRLLEARRGLKEFDLSAMPRPFDPLNDTLPAEISKLFDDAIAAARRSDEETLLDACHAIEAYFGFPKPNLLVKEAEVPGGMYSNMVAQLRTLKAEELLDDAMRLIPKVRRDAGLVPLVTPTSQIVGSQAVSLAIDRKKGNPDYTTKSNQFISLVKGEYGHTPAPIDPEFRRQITGSAEEKPYDVNSYRKPDNPELPEYDNARLASNEEEFLLLELLPNVANGFLRKKRGEEYAARHAAEEAARQAEAAKAEPAAPVEPITGPVLTAPMGGRIISVNVKDGEAVKKGQVILVYEAMKMENDVTADRDCVVKRILVRPDEVIGTDAPMVELKD